MKLNLGCGSQVVDGWINVDYALGARVFKVPMFRLLNSKFRIFNLDWDDRITIHDLNKTFPWNTASVEAIYSSHTLEHMTKEEGKKFIQECYRVLRKDGVIRIVVPDLKAFVEEYLNGDIKADDFLKDLGVLYNESDSYIRSKLTPFIQFPHKCMYDLPALLKMLSEIGFKVQSSGYLQSGIDGIEDVELKSRTINAVVVEGYK